MKFMIKLLTLLLLAIPATMPAMAIKFSGPNETNYQTQVGREFMLETHLAITSEDFKQWKLISYAPLVLVEEIFEPTYLTGSNLQRWFFKSNIQGNFEIILEREINGEIQTRIFKVQVI